MQDDNDNNEEILDDKPKRKRGFYKTEELGQRDPNIRSGPREKKVTTKRALKERELMNVLRKVKPHMSEAIMTAAKIMGNKEASHSNQLRAAVVLLDAYRALVKDVYEGQDEGEQGEEVQPQEQGVVFSLKVVGDE